MKETTENYRQGQHNGQQFVDMGLPSGLLWATSNVGTTKETETGLYFAWGETNGHEKDSGYNFSSKNYKAGPDGHISADLTLEQDAAHAYLGDGWRMPTKAEFEELINVCNSMWVTDYKNSGVGGMLLTSKNNGNTLFFPAAGVCVDTSLRYWGRYGYVWSSSFYSSSFAYRLSFNSGNCGMYGSYRYCGYPVRAVRKP